VIVGGSDAGIEAARCARQLDPTVEVSVMLADRFPNYSLCGLPYFLSGEVADWRSLAHRSSDELERAGIELLLEHSAEAIDPQTRTVRARTTGGRRELRYDKLIMAVARTGSATKKRARPACNR
jgi:NADPH-dependent 2,4-dienoyl-CoA reductase/sulfur reductase-like enzyme